MEVGASEAKNRLGMLLDMVECGEEVVITRHGKAVARLVPHATRIDKPQARVAMERIRRRAGSLEEAFDWETARADRNAGRP